MIKEQIQAMLFEALTKLGYPTETIQIDQPTQMEFGDYSSNIAMQLAKALKKNPLEIAKQIAERIGTNENVESVTVLPPGFINFKLSARVLRNELHTILTKKEAYGTKNVSNQRHAVVEYSSPNIAKPFTIGHLRSTIIGNAIANLLEATGWDIKRDNHVGDWGTQFGKQIYAIEHWGNLEELEKSDRPVKLLVELYVKFHQEAELHPEIEDEARAYFKKLENGDAEMRNMWQKCIEWSWKEFDSLYQRLGVHFTENAGRGYGESFFEDKMAAVIQELESKNLLKESQGAKLVFFENDNPPPLMILKKDGATLYATRDLATDKFRLETYGSDIKIINEVGAEQALYFQQLFKTEELLGWIKPGQRVHIKHGLYRFKDQKMSTRKGNTIWLEDVLDEAVKRAYALRQHENEFDGPEVVTHNVKISPAARKHNLGFATPLNNSEKIAIGAIKWNDLKKTSAQDVVFDWDEILNMQGNSGPYLQYAYVRCRSIIQKMAEVQSGTISPEAVFDESEQRLMRTLLHYPEVVTKAAESYAPHVVCTYLFELAQTFNLFYQNSPILKAEPQKQSLRLALTEATSHILKNGLYLLGIETVEKM
ncbi:arginine--tRNA ligase [Candidatus Roizmanbacteria bacterium]|nr:arginine--tRNA ligase [Candidatus Roizmanbacteria bacterium]